MTRARIRLLIAYVAFPVVVGGLVGISAGALGGGAGLAVAVVGVLLIALLGPRFFARYVAPRQIRAVLRRMIGAGEVPPAGARPIDFQLADRYAAALNARDWGALTELAAVDLVLVHPDVGRRSGRKRFVKSVRVATEAYPDLRIVVEEVVADPASPDVAWVRFLETGQPRVGVPLRASWWERWTLGDDGQTLRELALARAMQVD